MTLARISDAGLKRAARGSMKIQDAKITQNSPSVHHRTNLLPWSHLVRDLGITIDDHLDFKKHISNIVHGGKSRASLILKCFASRDPRILVKAYTTFVRPLLEFGRLRV